MRKILFMALAVLIAAGCAESEKGTLCVKIAPAIRTRVTGLHFDTGDRIGLTISKGSAPYAENVPMTYDGTAFTASGLSWYNDLNEKSVLTAYYPYAEGGRPDEFTVSSDQTQGNGPSDLLAAVKTDVTPVSAPVGMIFYHVMSQLTIVVSNSSSAAVTGVSVGGLVPTAEIDYSAPKAAAKSGVAAAEVKTCEVKPGATYRAILAPQQAALTVTVTTDDGRSHTKTLSSAQLESGRRYDMSVLVTNEEIQISLSGDIGDWEDGGSLDGSGGGDDGDDSQTLSYGGVTYRTRTVGETVWMAENLRYVPDEALLTKGIWYPDGNEDAEYVREHGMLYSFTVALGGAQVVSGAPVRGICPEGWHVPYIDELQTLAAGPDCGFTLAGMWNSVSKNYVSSAKSGYLMSATTDDGGSSYSALLFYASGGNPSPSSLPAGNGVSLRCVKDAK
ncbi:fimbrillin family protein [Alistipes sp.]|uniref:fimbrillin family protein n=1 Tax=Alistipes TaxID=239759 RepID=UPI0023F1DAA8|nr:fimbrillin family protein [Alistipes sp.]MBS6297461.1 fimbrillin family protein [Alistipes sp.]